MDGLKIGVGMITAGNREIPKQIYEKSCGDVYVYHDEKLEGPSTARNKVLAHFKGYDYIFIFDDDCYPEQKGWEYYFIEQSRLHNVHWMGVPGYFDCPIHVIEGEMAWWVGGLGPFQFFSKNALETIGGYNTEYDRYGWEDIAIEARASKAGLLGKPYGSPFPIRGMAYIKPLDQYDNPGLYANMPREEKVRYAKLNRHIMEKEVNNPNVFYPYE